MSTAQLLSPFDRLTPTPGASAQTLANRLGGLIRRGEFPDGSVIPSERQLSQRLQLPRGAVRTALQQLQDEGLLDGRQGRVRRVRARAGQASVMSRTVVVLGFDRLPEERIRDEQGWETYAQFTASARLQEGGYHLLTLNPQGLQRAYLTQFGQDPPAGLLVPRYVPSDAVHALMAHLAGAGVPVAVYGEPDAHAPTADRIVHDHAAGAAELTRWLIARGRRRILPFWRFPAKQAWVHRREEGYRRAMQEAGLDPMTPLRTPDLRLAGGAEPFDDMVRLQVGYLHEVFRDGPSVDALMCANDLHAVEAAEVVRRLGLTPGRDVLITGYDNTFAGDHRNPRGADAPSATIDKQNAHVGRTLADLLLERIGGKLPASPQCRSTPFQLVVPEPAFAPSDA